MVFDQILESEIFYKYIYIVSTFISLLRLGAGILYFRGFRAFKNHLLVLKNHLLVLLKPPFGTLLSFLKRFKNHLFELVFGGFICYNNDMKNRRNVLWRDR